MTRIFRNTEALRSMKTYYKSTHFQSKLIALVSALILQAHSTSQNT